MSVDTASPVAESRPEFPSGEADPSPAGPATDDPPGPLPPAIHAPR